MRTRLTNVNVTISEDKIISHTLLTDTEKGFTKKLHFFLRPGRLRMGTVLMIEVDSLLLLFLLESVRLLSNQNSKPDCSIITS